MQLVSHLGLFAAILLSLTRVHLPTHHYSVCGNYLVGHLNSSLTYPLLGPTHELYTSAALVSHLSTHPSRPHMRHALGPAQLVLLPDILLEQVHVPPTTSNSVPACLPLTCN